MLLSKNVNNDVSKDSPIDHVSVSPANGIGPTQGQRKTLPTFAKT